MKHFSSHMNSMFVNELVKKLNKTNKNPKFKSESIFMENNTNRQSWCHDSFMQDHNTKDLFKSPIDFSELI